MSASPGITYLPEPSTTARPVVSISRVGPRARMMPFSSTTVWSSSSRSASMGTTVTWVSASAAAWRAGSSSGRNSGFMSSRTSPLRLVLPGLLPHRLGVELVEVVDQLVGHELLDVHLGLEAGGLALRGRGHELLQSLPASDVVQAVLAGSARLHDGQRGVEERPGERRIGVLLRSHLLHDGDGRLGIGLREEGRLGHGPAEPDDVAPIAIEDGIRRDGGLGGELQVLAVTADALQLDAGRLHADGV